MILQDFITNNPHDWKELLKAKPYCLTINEDNSFVIFSYNQIESDFKEEIVREARGIILRKSDFSVVCWPFTKFFNYREVLADNDICFSTSRVQEKIDGSIMKLWFDKVDNKWNLSTNNVIDARNYTSAMGTSFYTLFKQSFELNYGDFNKFTESLNIYNTYIFELTHPETKIVIPYKPNVYHIGTRDNLTGKELPYCDVGVKKPKEYSFQSIDDVIAMTKTLPWQEEGYVVVDYRKDRVKRVKIKSLSYCAASHLKNNGVVTYKRIMHIILNNEQEEFCSIFPEYKSYFNIAEAEYNKLISDLEIKINEVKNKTYSNKKEYAMDVKDNKMSCFFFEIIKPGCQYKYDDYKKFIIEKVGAEKVADILKLKDCKFQNKNI